MVKTKVEAHENKRIYLDLHKLTLGLKRLRGRNSRRQCGRMKAMDDQHFAYIGCPKKIIIGARYKSTILFLFARGPPRDYKRDMRAHCQASQSCTKQKH